MAPFEAQRGYEKSPKLRQAEALFDQLRDITGEEGKQSYAVQTSDLTGDITVTSYVNYDFFWYQGPSIEFSKSTRPANAHTEQVPIVVPEVMRKFDKRTFATLSKQDRALEAILSYDKENWQFYYGASLSTGDGNAPIETGYALTDISNYPGSEVDSPVKISPEKAVSILQQMLKEVNDAKRMQITSTSNELLGQLREKVSTNPVK